MSPKYKVTRARSEEKKEDQFERIIEAGKTLFLKKGVDGFSMRNLADNLGMTKNNLYNYVSSKRELWIAIRNKFYSQFKQENLEIIRNHQGTNKELMLKLFDHFNTFAKRDNGVFSMMFVWSNAPPSKNIGKIEETYKEFRLLDGTTKILRKSVENGEFSVKNPPLASILIYSILFGTTYVDINRKEGNPLLENIQFAIDDISSEEFHAYVVNILEKLLTMDLL